MTLKFMKRIDWVYEGKGRGSIYDANIVKQMILFYTNKVIYKNIQTSVERYHQCIYRAYIYTVYTKSIMTNLLYFLQFLLYLIY